MNRETTMKELSKTLDKDISKIREYFGYLDELKKTGQTKFFGGIPKLMEKYPKMSRQEATTITMKWMGVQ